MCSDVVIIACVRSQDPAHMRPTKNDDNDLGTRGESIRSTWRGRSVPDAHGAQPGGMAEKPSCLLLSAKNLSRRWNTGLLVGQKKPLQPKHVWSIRVRLKISRKWRDLALFNLAIDSKLRACDSVKLRLDEVCSGAKVRGSSNNRYKRRWADQSNSRSRSRQGSLLKPG